MQEKMKNTLNIDRIAFIGRTFAEYISLFDLDENILKQGPVLDCPAGAASFTAKAHKLGINVTACDILFNSDINSLLDDILSFLNTIEIKAEIVKIPFEFQKGSNQMMKIWDLTVP